MILSRLQQGKLLSELSTFGIGGPAKLFVEASSIAEMQEILSYCSQEKLPFIVIGKGSNTLFDDRGFNGLVILNRITFCEYQQHQVYVGAGYSFSLLGVQTAKRGLSGLEFASGIPGSVGGAVYMNAGAGGSDTFSVLAEATYIDAEGKCTIFKKEEISFGYRFSSFQKQKGAIVAARFHLTPQEGARQKQLSLIDYRMKTQPYKDKSAGCVFRNPTTGSAGALIEACGLKGATIGGAVVSPMHANFIVNNGSATAQDIKKMAELIKKTVKEKKGIDLEMEVRHIPYDSV
ncbi:MAG TPA: UDP-N-acetylmuramate dehydrogenase [Rhabdochlamydiaceae bacterium]|nr:UDP-N-acetylmuramate dehydrogenase [Rhabdochlamydiaceae bacterium]